MASSGAFAAKNGHAVSPASVRCPPIARGSLAPFWSPLLMSTHLVEIPLQPSRVAAALGTLSYTLIFREVVHLQFPRLHCHLVIQNPSRDVINELEILVELILGKCRSAFVSTLMAPVTSWCVQSPVALAGSPYRTFGLQRWSTLSIACISDSPMPPLTCNGLESLLLAWLISQRLALFSWSPQLPF